MSKFIAKIQKKINKHINDEVKYFSVLEDMLLKNFILLGLDKFSDFLFDKVFFIFIKINIIMHFIII